MPVQVHHQKMLIHAVNSIRTQQLFRIYDTNANKWSAVAHITSTGPAVRTWPKEVFTFPSWKRFGSNLASREGCIYQCTLSALAGTVLATSGPQIETAGHVLAFVDLRWLDFVVDWWYPYV